MDNQNIEFERNWKDSLPIGYRFRPKNVELLKYYLLAKVSNSYYNPGIINELDVYAYQPWDLPGMDEEESEGYYFTQRNKKCPNGKRPSRLVYVKTGSDEEARPQPQGFWKMSCKMDDIRDRDGKLMGKKNSLNYFCGSVKTEWKMHEFMLDPCLIPPKGDGKSDVLDEVVLCRIYTSVKDDRKQGKTAEMPQIRSSEGLLNQQISSIPETSQQPLKRKQPSSYQQEQSNKRALDQQPSAHPVPLTLVRQVPSTAEPLTQLVGAQTSLTKLSMPLPMQPKQNHIVDLALPQGGEPTTRFVVNEAQLPQGGEPTTHFVPDEAQLPQGGEFTSFVPQPQQPRCQYFNTSWAQCGDFMFQPEKPNLLEHINMPIQPDLQQLTCSDPNVLNNIELLPQVQQLRGGGSSSIIHITEPQGGEFGAVHPQGGRLWIDISTQINLDHDSLSSVLQPNMLPFVQPDPQLRFYR